MTGQPALTLKNLVDETLSLMGLASETGTIRTMVEERIRANHDNRVLAGDYSFMRFPYPSTLTLTAGVRDYALHPAFRSPIYFRSRTTGEDLVEVNADMLLDGGLSAYDATGEAKKFELKGVLNVKAQPTEAGVLTATSSAGADDGNTVTVVGETSAGAVVEETLTLPNAGTTEFLRILAIRKNGDTWTGTLTITHADGTVVQTLSASSYGQQYRHFYLHLSPTSAEVIEYEFWALPNRLEEDYDIPNIPAPFSRILIYDALLDTQGYSRPTAGEVQRWEQKQMELQHALDSAYQEGLSNGAQGSYVHLVPR